MAELKRKPQNMEDRNEKEPLTTADLTGRAQERSAPGTEAQPQDWSGRPTLVRKEDERADPRAVTPPETASTPLFAEVEITELRTRWSDVQSAFVDEPRKAVEGADKLVATVMQHLADGFANERSNLEKQWARGGDVSTEDLRLALQRYRSFFDRLLKA